jgi:hypothetical protein
MEEIQGRIDECVFTCGAEYDSEEFLELSKRIGRVDDKAHRELMLDMLDKCQDACKRLGVLLGDMEYIRDRLSDLDKAWERECNARGGPPAPPAPPPTPSLKQLIEMSGKSNQELASLIGVNQTALSRWVRGVNMPNGRSMKDLARVFFGDETRLADIREACEPHLRAYERLQREING